MFREIRRKDKEKTEREAVEIMKRGTNGVLSVNGDGGISLRSARKLCLP